MENQMFQPLIKAIEDQSRHSITPPMVEDFMFMGCKLELTPSGMVEMYAFKHIDSRRYIHLDDKAQAWINQGSHIWEQITNGLAFERCYDLTPTGK